MSLIRAADDLADGQPPAATLEAEQARLLPWLAAPPGLLDGERASLRVALSALDAWFTMRGSPARHSRWRAGASALVTAFWREARWRTGLDRWPNEVEYLAVADVSVGVPWVAAALALLAAEPIDPLAEQTAVAAIARALRLANDLDGVERERAEGKPQAVVLRSAEGATTLDHAIRGVEADLARAVRRAHDALAPERWGTAPCLRAALCGMLGVTLRLYTPAHVVTPPGSGA